MELRLRVLHLEDDRIHADLARALLAEDCIDCVTHHVATEIDFVAALAGGEFDLVLADFTLPGFDGLHALEMVRQRFPDLPFIFVTGTMGEEVAIDTLKRGATDYILKSRLSRLAPAVRRAVAEAGERRERRRAEEALRRAEEETRRMDRELLESERKFRTAFEEAAVGMCLTSVDHRFLTVNRSFCTMLGYSSEELSAMDWIEVTHPLDREKCRVWSDRILAGEELSPSMEKRYLHRNGRIVWGLVTKVLLRGDAGEPLYFVNQIQDVTELKNLENQLRHSQKMEALGTLTGGIAHDFNNILTAIIGYGGLLEMNLEGTEPLGEYVGNILSAADRAATLTQSLLAFGRKQTLEQRVVDLNEVVGGVGKFLLRLLREDIELRTSLAPEVCMVLVDSGQIEQVLMNLATNARDAMPDGGRLAISTSVVDLGREFVATHGYGTPGRYALLTVSDNGRGMDEETRNRIFEPFFTTKEVGKGTGLGLSMAYGIVKSHLGYITCYSEPGGGTTFRVYLPLVDALAEPISALEACCMPGGTETILVAEDDEQVRMLTHKLLESFGYTVIEARDGNDALVQFRARREEIRLVLLDVIMPVRNGREVYEEMIREMPELKAIFTSGYSADVFRQWEVGGENCAFISKPASPAELLQKIRAVLDGGN
jgi:PAS domain S-box-containing protein